MMNLVTLGPGAGKQYLASNQVAHQIVMLLAINSDVRHIYGSMVNTCSMLTGHRESQMIQIIKIV
ncbi:hypothetical protein B566_EDAN015340 [Ephemera danica]|nr:hypothetical protein B566_EDAN015340 [Ephemera danica]